MEKIDDLTQARLREWQMRRLEIKDQMQSQPARTLELSQLLDQMDDEHAAILAASTRVVVSEPVADAQPAKPAVEGVTLDLNICANNLDDLRRMLDMAVHEVQREIDAGEQRRLAGGMSGSLGDYRFALSARAVSSKS